MAKYTVSLLELARSRMGEYVGSSGIEKMVNVLQNYLFDFDYPVYNASKHKNALEQKFIKHFLMYEIGFETPALFKLFLESKMLMIMPYYNMLYKINDLLEEIDLLRDRDMKIEEEGEEAEKQEQSSVRQNKNSRDVQESVDREENSQATDNVEKSGTNTDTETPDTTKTYVKNETRTPNLSETTEYGKVDTLKKTGQTDVIQEGNTANSDFPQGNVYAANNEYFTSGVQGSNKTQNEIDTTDKTTLSGSDTTKETGNEKYEGSNTETLAGSTTTTHQLGEKTESATTAKQEDTEARTLKDVYDLLEDALNELNRNQSHKNKRHEYGLTGNRTIASIVGEIAENYINVDEQIINECRDLFMLVY